MDRADNGNAAPLPDYVRRAERYTDDPLAAARELRPVIESEAAEADRIALLTETQLRALCTSGLLGMLIPKELGGSEVSPATYIDVIDELSYADGSFGWVVMATTFTTMGMAAWLGPEAIEAAFEQDNGFAAVAHIAPNGVAERVDGGYRIQGQFHFGSGSQIASWFMGAFVLHDGGKPVVGPGGVPQMVWAFAPRERIDLDTASWDVAGMRSTASWDFRFVDQVARDDFTFAPGISRLRGGPVLDIGVSIGHAAVVLGVARRILDEIHDIASRKRRVGRATLIDQPAFQRDYVSMRAYLEATRAYLHEVYAEWFADAEANGTASLATRAKARAAACWGTKVTTEVAQWAYTAAGTNGLRNSPENRLQRCFRDMQAAAVHRHVDDNVLIEAATVRLGIDQPGLVL